MSNFAKTKNFKICIVAIILILGGSIFAYLFNTSFFSTNVDRINFETDKGILSGLLYKPKGASAEDPRPTIITTHGYLNSAEMQDAAAVELSRRGYVVLALDMYDHGHSINQSKFDSSGAFFSFWPTSIYDTVQHMYEKDYVLKDDSGNGIIAVAGHSMGGFSSTMAMIKDENDFKESGIRKIHAGLTMGSDYLWTGYLDVTPQVATASHGPRIVGKVAAHYDDFFFDPAATKSGKTVVYKDYVDTKPGQIFLGKPANPKSGKMYSTKDGGKRVIYTPREIHPWNHFSATTTSHQIEFYNKAFAGYRSSNQRLAGLDPGSQIWFYKELSEFVALIGFFLLFIPLTSILLKMPFLSNAKTNMKEIITGPKKISAKLIYWLVILIGSFFPAFFFPALMSKSGPGMTILKRFALLAIAISVIWFIIKLVKEKKNKLKAIKSEPLLLLITSSLLYWILKTPAKIFKLGSYFNEPTTNQILYWAMAVTGVIAIITIVYYSYNKKFKNISLSQYGIKENWTTIFASLVTAAVSVVIGYVVLFIIDAVLTVDFRIWTWAVKTFEFGHFVAALKYIPFFFLYFYVTGITINSNTNYMSKFKGYLTAIFSIVGGLVIYLILHYGKLFIDGQALMPAQALSSILLIALIPTLIVATIYNKYLFKKTGNVYTGAFLNTFLMTMITVANTTLYHNIM